MNTTKHFQLIDGTFTPDQARQVLGAMVKSKIDFHTLENHSEGERSGITHHAEERLGSLRALDADLKMLFENARRAGVSLKVKGNIEISFVETDVGLSALV